MNAREELFGREDELTALKDFVAAAEPRAILLEGEPGIGKTSLWRNALEEAARGGARVLSASPASGEAQLSFAVLADLLGPALDDVGGQLPAPQRRALSLALLLEEAGGEEAVQQRTVFAATLSTLRLLADSSPVLLAVDDVQWVDAASASALGFAIRRLGDAPVSIIGTKRSGLSRDTDGQIESAIESRHGSAMQIVEVGPLSMSSVHDAIRIRFGTTFAPSVMQRVHVTSGGNPRAPAIERPSTRPSGGPQAAGRSIRLASRSTMARVVAHAFSASRETRTRIWFEPYVMPPTATFGIRSLIEVGAIARIVAEPDQSAVKRTISSLPSRARDVSVAPVSTSLKRPRVARGGCAPLLFSLHDRRPRREATRLLCQVCSG